MHQLGSIYSNSFLGGFGHHDTTIIQYPATGDQKGVFRAMGKKNQARKGRTGTSQGGAVDSLSADLSDLFKTLPPIKRADLTKTVEKLFQVV